MNYVQLIDNSGYLPVYRVNLSMYVRTYVCWTEYCLISLLVKTRSARVHSACQILYKLFGYHINTQRGDYLNNILVP